MVRILISVAFWGEALIKRRRLLEAGTYCDLSVNGATLISGRRLFEVRRLLEEILYFLSCFLHKMITWLSKLRLLSTVKPNNFWFFLSWLPKFSEHQSVTSSNLVCFQWLQTHYLGSSLFISIFSLQFKRSFWN